MESVAPARPALHVPDRVRAGAARVLLHLGVGCERCAKLALADLDSVIYLVGCQFLPHKLYRVEEGERQSQKEMVKRVVV